VRKSLIVQAWRPGASRKTHLLLVGAPAALCGLRVGGPTAPKSETIVLKAYSDDLLNPLNAGLYCRTCINAAAKMAA
jgi:hypothetical protein